MATNKGITEAFDPDKAKVCDLKVFLRDHNQPISGLKYQLIERAKGVLELNLPDVNKQRECDNSATQARHLDRLITPLGESLPDPILLKKGWTDDILRIPNFTNAEVYNYLVLSKCRTIDGEAIKAKRQLRGKVFVNDRHVYNVEYHDVSEECSHAFVKCKVIRSLPQKKDKKAEYDTWVCLAKVSGRVHSAGCGCDAGEGESCNHIAALLYTMVDITEKKKAGLTASTSKACLWNRPRARKLSPTRSQDLVFKKLKFEEKENVITSSGMEKPKKQKTTSSSTVKPVNLVDFCEKLKQVNPYAAVVLCSDYNKNGTEKSKHDLAENLGLTDVDFMYSDNTDLKSGPCEAHFDQYIRDLCDTTMKSYCEQVELKTRGQAKNTNWVNARKGRITSSLFGTVFKRKLETDPDYVIKTVFGYSSFQTSATKWGSNHEPAARRMYANEMKSLHPSIKIDTSGLVVKDDEPYLAASPDGIVNCSCKVCGGGGILEIKCPFKHRFVNPVEAVKDPAFCCTLVNGKLKLKKNHNYYFQVQGQMAICGKKWCDFYVWTLKGSSVERIYRDEAFCEKMFEKLRDFYRQYIVLELFSQRVKRGKKL